MVKLRMAVGGLLGALSLSGCEGELNGPATGNTAQKPDNSAPDPDEPVQIDAIETTDPELLPDGVSVQSRVPRLSYDEYDRAVFDLVGILANSSALFPDEQPNLGPYEDPGSRKVGERLLQEVVLAAEQLSLQAVENAETYAALVACSPSPECRDDFIRGLVLRAYRRPARDDETQRFSALFDSAGELIQSGDAFRDGVQLVLEAVLQSAKFSTVPSREAALRMKKVRS